MGKKKLTTPEPIVEQKVKPAKEIVTEQTPNSEQSTEVESTKTKAVEKEVKTEKKAEKQTRTRGKKYIESRSRVDKTKLYSVSDAVKLVKELSFSKFTGSIEAHLQLREVGAQATITFPHSIGKTVRVAIVNEELIEQINKGEINFDILLARPADMKLLTKFARTLGPKGLMPNPKNGTLTPKPETKKKELEAGAITVKTERKAPLIHQVIGKTDMTEKELSANIEALLKAFTTKALKLHICASMSPSVRVMVG